MKLLFTQLRLGRAHDTTRDDTTRDVDRPVAGDDSLARGMDVALTLLAFLVFGYLLDQWLGLFPLFTISLVVFAAVGTFIRLKYVYDATMERLEAERAAARAQRRATTGMEDAA